MSLFSIIGCFIGQVILALIIFVTIVIMLMASFGSTSSVFAKPLVPVDGYTLDVTGSDPSKQEPFQNVESAEACSVVASLKNAPVAVYIPAMKVCTVFTDAVGLKLIAPADPNMVVLSNVEIPKA